jgi:NAD(P)-dependent dehydrogenase (short-subunit alcohol dehydrogenase family)
VSATAVVHARSNPDHDAPVALVTGGARNIGLAIAGRLQTDGYQVLVTTYEVPGGPEAAGEPASVPAAEAAALGARRDWDVLTCDLATPQACVDLVAFIAARYGRLDCLVNNAATWTYGPALQVSDDDWRRVLEVNVLAAVRLIREAHPLMRSSPAPRIVNVSSIGAEWAGNGVAPYNVSKAGVNSLTRALAVELADDGILVNAIAPGFIDTSSNGHELGDAEVLGRRLALVPAGKPGAPEDVANLVSFLASPDLAFVTGSIVTIDGGQLAGARTGLIG